MGISLTLFMDKNNYHLKGVKPEEVEFVRSLAKWTAEAILKEPRLREVPPKKDAFREVKKHKND